MAKLKETADILVNTPEVVTPETVEVETVEVETVEAEVVVPQAGHYSRDFSA